MAKRKRGLGFWLAAGLALAALLWLARKAWAMVASYERYKPTGVGYLTSHFTAEEVFYDSGTKAAGSDEYQAAIVAARFAEDIRASGGGFPIVCRYESGTIASGVKLRLLVDAGDIASEADFTPWQKAVAAVVLANPDTSWDAAFHSGLSAGTASVIVNVALTPASSASYASKV